MSLEYFVAVTPTQQCVAEMVSELGRSDAYEVLDTSGRIALRFKAHPARSEWPEDVEIKVDDGVLVVFHSAHRAERERLLSSLQAVLKSCGYSEDFEEL